MKAKLDKADLKFKSFYDLECPHCKCKIDDEANYGDSDYYSDNEPEINPQNVTCPDCKGEFKLEIEVKWTYKARI